MTNLHRTRGAPAPGWGLPLDDDPLPLRAAGPISRWLWPSLAVAGFLALVSFVLAHDDPSPGLSDHGLLTVAVAAVVVVLLTIRRTAGPGPLARTLLEYAVVFLLAVLVATTGAVGVDQPATPTNQASATEDHRPAILRTVEGFWDWLGEWREWARKETDRRTRPPSTTTPGQGRAMAPSPAPPSSTRRPL